LHPTLYETLLQAAGSLPPLTPDALEQLECKIQCSLLKAFMHLIEPPTDLTTINHNVPDSVLTPGKPVTALPSVPSLLPTPPCSMNEMPLPPAKPPYTPLMPSPPTFNQPHNNMPNCLPSSDITVPSRHQKNPPDCIDRMPKRLRTLIQTQIPQPSHLHCPSSAHGSPYAPPQQAQKSLCYTKQMFKPP